LRSLVAQDPLDNIVYWISSIRTRASKKVPIVLVGTHLDQIKNYDSAVHAKKIIDYMNTR
jgi:hypothetical protein